MKTQQPNSKSIDFVYSPTIGYSLQTFFDKMWNWQNDDKRFYFFLRPTELEPSKRTYKFYAESREDYLMWKEALTQLCNASGSLEHTQQKGRTNSQTQLMTQPLSIPTTQTQTKLQSPSSSLEKRERTNTTERNGKETTNSNTNTNSPTTTNNLEKDSSLENIESNFEIIK